MLPIDHPYPNRNHRIYVALTNHCNRSCPWCSMFSSPKGRTYLTKEKFINLLPPTNHFELQLEGGEPTTHPQFYEFIEIAKSYPNMKRLIICTNGTRIPRGRSLAKWLANFNMPFTLKVSINHHLLEHDAKLIDLAKSLTRLMPASNPNQTLVLNVRLRKGVADDDQQVLALVENAGLKPWCNIFYLQRYGLASDITDWKLPFAIGDNFTLVNPDGIQYGNDLVKRSKAMEVLS